MANRKKIMAQRLQLVPPSVERIRGALVEELTAAFNARTAAEQAVLAHNAQGAQLQEALVSARAVLAYLYEKATVEYELKRDDSLDLTQGIVLRAGSPVNPAPAPESAP